MFLSIKSKEVIMSGELLKKALSEGKELSRQRTLDGIASMSEEEAERLVGGPIPFNEEDMAEPDPEDKT